MNQTAIGKTASADATVNQANTAEAVGSGSLEVFATPMMLALMEKAACECLKDGLEIGETSVGTFVNISHTAASPIGAKITATAVVKNISGRKIEFEITAFDHSSQKEIGRGEHTRMVIDEKRFMEKLK
ncbi:MAG: thioesterase family protein [Oscillospiraceae bacterium]|nr:thioesterase family protein [Oscillospiraceae bacterium]